MPAAPVPRRRPPCRTGPGGVLPAADLGPGGRGAAAHAARPAGAGRRGVDERAERRRSHRRRRRLPHPGRRQPGRHGPRHWPRRRRRPHGARAQGTVDSGTGEVVVAAAGELRRHNDDLLYGAEPGALGEALVAAGRSSAVVANADVVEGAAGLVLHREAALAMMDASGRSGGSVAPDLAVVDPAVPGERRVDDAAVLAAFGDVWQPGAVVTVEMSDLDRAARTGTQGQLAEALRRSDGLLAALLAAVDPGRDLVVVVAPVAPGDEAELTVFAMAGPGIAPGLARSPSTRRDGYVTLPDVAPTLLEALGVPVPDAMTGTAITASAGSTGRPGRTSASGRAVGVPRAGRRAGECRLPGPAARRLRGHRAGLPAGSGRGRYCTSGCWRCWCSPRSRSSPGRSATTGSGSPGYAAALVGAALAVAAPRPRAARAARPRRPARRRRGHVAPAGRRCGAPRGVAARHSVRLLADHRGPLRRHGQPGLRPAHGDARSCSAAGSGRGGPASAWRPSRVPSGPPTHSWRWPARSS